jgi:molybdopterin molybdotransferase
MLSVEEALEQLLKDVEPLPTEDIPLSDALSRVLAEDVISTLDLPPFPNSSMDGFAVRAEDVQAAAEKKPVILKVVADISAGEGTVAALQKGLAARIMTGGALPDGADAVVPVEFTNNSDSLSGKDLQENVTVLKGVSSGDFIRAVGQDVPKGTKILSVGHRLRPQDIGMLAALGIDSPKVFRKPIVAIISTGDELIDVGDELRPGTIHDSNGYSLSAAVQASGGIPVPMGIVPDDTQKLEEKLDRCVKSKVDLIVSSAGVSMGAFDFVRSVVQNKGQLEFWRVNIRPGKPIIKGLYGGIPILGLPGNPVSALVIFELFVKPFLNRLSGAKSVKRLRLMARLIHPIETGGRENFLRAEVKQDARSYEVRLTGSQDSGVLSSLIKANALIRVPAGIKSLSSGDLVEVIVLQQDGIL